MNLYKVTRGSGNYTHVVALNLLDAANAVIQADLLNYQQAHGCKGRRDAFVDDIATVERIDANPVVVEYKEE